MGRRSNGEGTLFKRKDGRWSAQAYVTLPNGTMKRICITARDHNTVKTKLREALDKEHRNIPFVERDWTVGEYLDYWLEGVQRNRIRETTMSSYSTMLRCHIKPTLGGHKLKTLSVHDIRVAIESLQAKGCSGRTVQKCLQILSACLNCAMREELIFRNVAQIAEKPKHVPKQIHIWSAAEAATFLAAIEDHPHYIAFLLFLTYGLRRGEVLGLRWIDIDFDNNLIHIRQQIDRIDGKIMARDVKTENSRRALPLMAHVRNALLNHATKNAVALPPFDPSAGTSTSGTVVTSVVGTPLEPRNLTRCFNLLLARCGLPRITIHAMRHTAATALKDLNIPVKDAQLILGHSNISTTLNIYQHGTLETHRAAISAMEERLLSRKLLPQGA